MTFAGFQDTQPPSPEEVRDALLRMLKDLHPGSAEHRPLLAERARATAVELGLTIDQVIEVVQAAELHDVGKLAIPEKLLAKPSALDAEEWALIRRHPMMGERMVAAAPELQPVAAIVRSSNERWDGEGYPDGLVGDRIPIGARIVAVCVAFAAMTSPRAYRPIIPRPVALAELCRCSGSHFDPVVVDAFIEALVPVRP